MKMRWFALITLIVGSTFFSFRSMFLPDPEAFAKKLLGSLQKNNKQEYINDFSFTYAEAQWMTNEVNSDAYLDQKYKTRWAEKMEDTLFVSKINRDVEQSYYTFQEWIEEEKIDLNALEYIRIYFELECEKLGSVYVLDEADLYVKYKDKYYCFEINEAVYANGKWIMGRIDRIGERNQYLDRIEEDYSYGADSTMVSYDTTAVAADYYEEYPADTTALPPALTKKQQKLQKKIDSYYEKAYKLESELYQY